MDAGEERLTEATAPPSRRRKTPDWLKGNTLLLPTTVWFAFLLLIPMAFVIEISLAKRSIFKPFTFDPSHLVWSNYRLAVNSQFFPIFTRS